MNDYSIGALMFLVLSGVGSALWYIIKFTLDRCFDADKGLITRLCNRWIEVADKLDQSFDRLAVASEKRDAQILTAIHENRCKAHDALAR